MAHSLRGALTHPRAVADPLPISSKGRVVIFLAGACHRRVLVYNGGVIINEQL